MKFKLYVVALFFLLPHLICSMEKDKSFNTVFDKLLSSEQGFKEFVEASISADSFSYTNDFMKRLCKERYRGDPVSFFLNVLQCQELHV